ncbi:MULTISPECIES: Sec-independent protein translocase protein TatB [Pseudomonadaceae]|uniref:Sec-independent protein translocase protein TatB n=1 Tax=Pseudomonadaceae TaxID=135621 RepID=UPI0015E33E6B|nr:MULTISPECIES: Sec-independent protein translocase protein TatB [Pseudomonadaceae]MBA1276385.1 Sec-independent protein translocase subunit TatB [Stutzerimonas stutzeri]MBC8648892.1 Sec-independent protein translocase subunit TatB [Pseudomonas sp. MT4]QXY92861.1 Sec-independent protein translocase subunit TatB [Pseudomonas sp. MTM4]
MFDIGFTELLLVGLVALFVLGPERLPGAVRTAGLWIGRAKRSFANIKAEVEREIGADEIRRQLHNERILDLEREMKQSIMPPSSPSAPAKPSPQSATPPPDANVIDAPTAEPKPAETTPAPRPDRPAEP